MEHRLWKNWIRQISGGNIWKVLITTLGFLGIVDDERNLRRETTSLMVKLPTVQSLKHVRNLHISHLYNFHKTYQTRIWFRFQINLVLRSFVNSLYLIIVVQNLYYLIKTLHIRGLIICMHYKSLRWSMLIWRKLD